MYQMHKEYTRGHCWKWPPSTHIYLAGSRTKLYCTCFDLLGRYTFRANMSGIGGLSTLSLRTIYVFQQGNQTKECILILQSRFYNDGLGSLYTFCPYLLFHLPKAFVHSDSLSEVYNYRCLWRRNTSRLNNLRILCRQYYPLP